MLDDKNSYCVEGLEIQILLCVILSDNIFGSCLKYHVLWLPVLSRFL